MKKILILGGAPQCLKVIKTAKKMGLFTIVTDSSPNAIGKKEADLGLDFGLTDIEGIKKWCINNPVDGILNFCFDIAVDTQKELCKFFNLPLFGNDYQYKILSNKIEFKKTCRASGLDVITDYSINDPQNIEYPVVVKPSENTGSRGVTVCNNYEELLRNYDKAVKMSFDNKALIEKCICGKVEFTIGMMVIDGEPYIYKTNDRFSGNPKFNLDRQAVALLCPSILGESLLPSIMVKIKKFIELIGIETAPFSMQGFIEKDKIVFFDPAIRFGGSEYESILEEVTGVNMMEIMIKHSLGESIRSYKEKLKNCYKLANKRSTQLFFDARPGTIKAFVGLDNVLKIDGVLNVIKKREIGDVIFASGDVKQKVLEIDLLTESSFFELKNKILEIQSLVSVLDTNDENMLVSLFDPSLLGD